MFISDRSRHRRRKLRRLPVTICFRCRLTQIRQQLTRR
jgi:hypothetical protein